MDPNLMPPQGPGQQGRLDASGQREVVFCHGCDNEWWQDEHGLVCPRCDGEIIEIVNVESDPRPPLPTAAPSPELDALRGHNPWAHDGDDSDPEEADIEEHITQNPNGSMRFTRTVRQAGPGVPQQRDDPDAMMRNFQDMIGNLMGPQLRHGQPGRSGADTLFNSQADAPPFPPGLAFGAPGPGNRRARGTTTRVTGGRVTYTYGDGVRTQIISGDNNGGPGDLSAILGSIFGNVPGRDGPGQGGIPGLPPGLSDLLGMFDPVNARSGDAVYSNEALDRIIEQLSGQNPMSNAPGPAPPEAIAALPKKKLSVKELGPEGKGECSVCMDDVKLGDEVVSLPCKHWFHEACASMWLGEHNTCPICRKGIDSASEPSPPASVPSSRRSTPPTTRNEQRARRLSNSNTSFPELPTSRNEARNEARLNYIRGTGNLPSSSSSGPPSSDLPPTNPWSSRYHSPATTAPRVPRESRPHRTSSSGSEAEFAGAMPGSFHRRPSDFSINERNREMERDRAAERDSRRASSRRSSHSGHSGNSGNANSGGVSGWIRDRFGGGGRS